MKIASTGIAGLVADIREQVLYLKELGVDSFDAEVIRLLDRGALADAPNVSSPAAASGTQVDVGQAIAARSETIPDMARLTERPPEMRSPGSRLASLPSLKDRPTSVSAETEKHDERTELHQLAAAPIEAVSKVKLPEESPELFVAELPVLPPPTETIEQIRAEIGTECVRCTLGTLGRKQVVNSVGNFNADLMFVGEAPGADEDAQGEPFVGRAGQLLTKIIGSIGLKREDVFIGNINRCRPPGNRAPEPHESVVCKPFLFREIAVVRPKVIVVLGATAAQNLLETRTPIGKLRGQFHEYLGTKVMPTFHPAYLLRDPHKKREVWEDMKLVRDYLNQVN